jgi:hypothetical protein
MQRNNSKIYMLFQCPHTVSAICGTKTVPQNKNGGIHMGEISKEGWPIGLIRNATWADFFYFPCLLLLPFSKILASFQPTL